MTPTFARIDHAAHLRAIMERPFDDGPRLVYAERLEDEREGNPLAEFIRIQIKLANPSCRMCWRKDGTKRNDGYSENCGRCKPLRQREQELLNANRDKWIAPIEQLGITAYEFHRGFPGHVECTLEQFCGGRCEHENLVSGDIGDNWRTPDRTTFIRCPDCYGTGRTPGIAKALFEAAPLTSVKLTDRKPFYVGDFWWHKDLSEESETHLPIVIFDRLDGFEMQHSTGRSYPTEADAYAALSRACFGHGRAAAGLPEVEEHK